MSTFWLQFIITESVGVAQAFVGTSNLGPNMKAALTNFIATGAALGQAARTPSE